MGLLNIMTKTNRIYQVTFTGLHARGKFEGESFTGTGYMELEDGTEYIYAEWHDGTKMCFQQIVPGSMTMRFEEFISPL